MKKALLLFAAPMALLGMSQQANAAVIINGSAVAVNGSTQIDFNGFSSPGVIDGLTSSLTLTLTSIVNNTLNFTYSLLNSSSSPVLTSRVTGFGFDTTPTASSASATGAFTEASVGDFNFANGVKNIDVCVTNQGCPGGGGTGVDLGDTGNGTLALTFGSDPSDAILSNFAVRYQSVTCVDGATCSGSGTGVPTALPEPGTWAMMLIGFGAIGAFMRRRKPVDVKGRVSFA